MAFPKLYHRKMWRGERNDPDLLRGKLGVRFLGAFLNDFAHNGARVIKDLRRERRQDYVKVALALLPKVIRIKEVEIEEISDEEFAEVLAVVRMLAAREKGNGQGEADDNLSPALTDRTDTAENR